MPPFHLFIDWRAAFLRLRRGWKVINPRAVQFIAHADFERVKPIKNIQLRQRNAIHTRGRAGLAHKGGVKPPAAPLAPCDRAKFMATRPQTGAIVIVQFRWKRPLAHASCVGLYDAQHIINRTWPKADTCRSLPCNDVGGGHKGISAKINVQQRALCALKQ